MFQRLQTNKQPAGFWRRFWRPRAAAWFVTALGIGGLVSTAARQMWAVEELPTKVTVGTPLPPLCFAAFPGRASIFHLTYTAVGSSVVGGQTGVRKSSQKTQTTVVGELQREVLKVTRDGWSEDWRFAGAAQLLIDGTEDIDWRRGVGARLGLPVRVEFDRTGRLLQLVVAEGSTTSLQYLWRELSAATLVVLRESGGSLGWDASEMDANGEYQASYAPTSYGAGEYHLQKTKLKYLHPQGIEDDPLAQLQVAGKASIGFDAYRGQVKDLHSQYSYHLLATAGELANWTTTVELTWQRDLNCNALGTKLCGAQRQATRAQGAAAVEATAAPAEGDAVPLTDAALTAQTDRRIQERVLGNVDFASLVRQLQLADAAWTKAGPLAESLGGELTPHARAALVNHLYAWLYLHPEAAPDLQAMLAEAPSGSPSFVFALGALAQVGSAAAQRALTAALDQVAADPAKAVAVTAALGQLRQPLAIVEAVLRAELQAPEPAVRSVAVLAMGNMAHASGQEDASRRGRLVAELALALNQAGSNAEKSLYVLALGNAPGADATRHISAYVLDADVMVRASSARALRHAPPASATEPLVQLLRSDADVSVRYAAAEAFFDWRELGSALPSLLAAARAESSPLVRTSIVRALMQHKSEAGVIAAVENVAASDPAGEVRKAASALLVGSKTDG